MKTFKDFLNEESTPPYTIPFPEDVGEAEAEKLKWNIPFQLI